MFLRRRAKEIVELVERTENDLITYNEAVSGVVHIGGVETHTIRLIGEAVLALKEQHPGIRYDFFSGSIAEITEALNKGILDFALLVAPVDMQKYDYLKLPVHDRFGLLMRKDSPLAELSSIHPEDLGDHPVWVAHQQLEGNVLSGWLGRDVQSLNIVATFNLITNPAVLVEQGFGMAFTFDRLVNTTGDSNLCFRPLEPAIEAELYLVWKKYQMFTGAAKVFLEQVQRDLGAVAVEFFYLLLMRFLAVLLSTSRPCRDRRRARERGARACRPPGTRWSAAGRPRRRRSPGRSGSPWWDPRCRRRSCRSRPRCRRQSRSRPCRSS